MGDHNWREVELQQAVKNTAVKEYVCTDCRATKTVYLAHDASGKDTVVISGNSEVEDY